MANILIIDDDEMIRDLLRAAVEDLGHNAMAAAGVAEGRLASRRDIAVAYVDICLPDGNGLDLLHDFQSLPDPPEVIIITGQGGLDGAETALRRGVWDYIEKPCSLDRMVLPLKRALRYRAEKARTREPMLLMREGIVGSSLAIRQCLQQVAKAASGQTDVLVTGETGTGKELFARSIHENSPRGGNPFVVVDCASLPEPLVESILFGHKRGAFTGAADSRPGLVEQANGGALFLDEVGELPQATQASLLRVLQERSFRPVGATGEVRSDFTLLAATNKDLRALSETGAFRRDLYYRLNAFTIHLPPLRERKDDIKELVQHYISRTGGRFQGGVKAVSPEFIQELWAHDWPGNVRELFHVLETSLVSAHTEPTLYPSHLPVEVRLAAANETLSRRPGAKDRNAPAPGNGLSAWSEFRNQALMEAERNYFGHVMALAKGDIDEACRISGVKPARLYQLLKKHEIARR